MEEQLKSLQKERIKQYKDQLRDEAHKFNKDKTFNQSYMFRRSVDNPNVLVERLKDGDDQRAVYRKKTQFQLKDQNTEMDKMRKSIFNDIQRQSKKHGGRSFMDKLTEGQTMMNSERKNYLKDQVTDNERINSHKRNYEAKVRSVEKIEDQIHMERMRELDEIRRRNQSNLLKKHSQNMTLFDKHQSLVKDNEKLKNQLQKFTQVQNDLLHNLRRNQYLERRKKTKNNQQEVIRQMENKKSPYQEHKEYPDIKNSLFGKMIRERPDYRKQLANVYQSQIGEFDSKKNQQKIHFHEKNKIKGVIGGEHGPERKNQILYVDQKLGIQHPNYKSQQISKITEIPQNEKVIIPASRSNRSEASSERPQSNNFPSNNFQEKLPIQNPMARYQSHQLPIEPNGFKRYDFIAGKTRILEK